MKQCTNRVMMVEPSAFRMNEETAVNNYFQKNLNLSSEEVNALVMKEFYALVELLKTKGVKVEALKDIHSPETPDAVFPNNWVSFHENQKMVLYPMFAKNRRKERRPDIYLDLDLQKNEDFEIIDMSPAEEDQMFLEGTGSMILDRENRIAYCALSPRADQKLFEDFCEKLNFKPIIFHAYQTINNERALIYHTNVMMCVGQKFVIICLDCIDNEIERETVVRIIEESNKEIIEVSEEQIAQFAGNMLEILGANNAHLLVMSKAAHDSLSPQQIALIEKYCEIVSSDLTTIETLGGGSARCMIAEIFE